MSIAPILTFKAGECEGDFDSDGPTRVTPSATPGYIYLYSEDDIIHFCWRERSQSLDNPKLDLVIIPSDATFKPYLSKGAPVKKSPVGGRLFVLKFLSSSVRHVFWLQSAAKDPSTPSFFSKGDLKLGEIVDKLLQGEDPDSIQPDLAVLGRGRHDGGYELDDDDDDEDQTMEDAHAHAPGRHDRRGSGGAGPDATGGDFREEGEDSRDGGGDGARAVPSASSAVPDDVNATIQNFLNSLGPGGSTPLPQQQQSADPRDDPFTTLADLLPATTTVPMLSAPTTTDAHMTELIVRHLPSSLLYLAHGMDPSEIPDEADSDPEAVAALADALEPEQRRDLVRRVLQSPQFQQAQTQLTQALRDGGLPAVAGAVGVRVQSNGYVNERAGIALNGGTAVRVFVEGVKQAVERERSEEQHQRDRQQ